MSPARAAFAALSRTVEDLAGLAGSAIRELPRSALPTDASGAGPPRTRALLRRAGARAVAGRSDPLPRGSGDARNGRAPRQRGRSHCSGAAPRPSESRWCASPSIAGARRSRRRSRSSRSRWRSSMPAASARRRSAGAARDSPLRVARRAVEATSSRSSARRSRGWSVDRSTSSRAACAAGPSRTGRGSRRRPRSSAARRCRRSPTSGRTTILSLPTRNLIALMVRNAWGLDSPPTTNDARIDARAYRAAERTLDELAALASADGATSRPRTSLVALERTRVAPESPERGKVAVLDHERARTRPSTSSSSSVSRRARSRVARGRRRS